MSAQENRQQIIRENLPILVECLTKFNKDEENFHRCEQFAWYTIRNHKNLSVNSHEIKRKIDGMFEKFIVGNYKLYADYLKQLCNELINHPICLNHYEVDVHWAVLDFLLNLSYNPVGSIRKNKIGISLNLCENAIQHREIDKENWLCDLKDDVIPPDEYSDNSELSDWTDSGSEISMSQSFEEKVLEKATIQFFPNLIPPRKEDNFQIYGRSNAREWLIGNIQNSWWLDMYSNCNVQSCLDSAHFCYFWKKYLAEKSNNIIKLKHISTASEYCLLREIIWMFQCPTNNKFFSVQCDEIYVRDDVSICSVTLEGFRFYLESIIPYIKMINSLRKFINSVYYYDGKPPPKIYEYYASCLQEFLDIFYTQLLNKEDTIKNQSPLDLNTVIQFQQDLNKSLEFVEKVYNIHSFVALDYKSIPAHICSAHLLAGLLLKFNLAHCPSSANMAMSIFLSTVQVFCCIIDSWWTEGQLDDWRNEFLVEKLSSESEEISTRPYAKSREKAFFVATEVSSLIKRDSFLKLLMEHSLVAGCTLNLLYQIKKIGDLKNACNFEKSLYAIFLEEVLSSVKHFQKNKSYNEQNGFNEICAQDDLIESRMNLIGSCATNLSPSFDDKFLFMVFNCNLKEIEEETNLSETEGNITIDKLQNKMNVLDIFEKLNAISNTILPLEEIVIKCMSNILQTRISFANKFVISMYRDEFEISKHFQNIRRVLLLESSDLMHSFYIKLFIQIESGKPWANPFLLTVQLDDIICSKFAHMSSLFRIEIDSTYRSQNTKVTEAVEELLIKYDIKKELQNIITRKSMEEYNKVFRFLLKVKWGLWSLENLNFPASHKKRPPYAVFGMSDLLMRRLEQLRFWLMYSIQCVHFHLMTHVLQSMGQQLDKKIKYCKNVTEMKSVHESYIKTVCEHCFTEKKGTDIKIGIEQLLCLIYVLRLEWHSFVREIESNDTDSDSCVQGNDPNYILSSQVEAIENTYIRCHQYLARILNHEVYSKQNSYLSGLSAAFNTSIPY